jgi:hypothetical protein
VNWEFHKNTTGSTFSRVCASITNCDTLKVNPWHLRVGWIQVVLDNLPGKCRDIYSSVALASYKERLALIFLELHIELNDSFEILLSSPGVISGFVPVGESYTCR